MRTKMGRGPLKSNKDEWSSIFWGRGRVTLGRPMEAWSNLEVLLCERATLERVKIIQSV